MTTTKKTKIARRSKGLIGLFGHTYVPDLDAGGDATMIQYQFEIIRTMEGARYVVQLFSWIDGSPTTVSVMSEAEMLGPTVKLYSTREDWCEGYDKESRKRRFEREANQNAKVA